MSRVNNFTISRLEDWPHLSTLESGIAYIVPDDDESDGWVLMLCPCGCKSVLQLNLFINVKPKWQIKSDTPLSISPSVNRTVGCKSHFTITNGVVKWSN